MKKLYILALILAAIGGAALAVTLMPSEPVLPPVYLPGDVVVEQVRSEADIATIAEQAGLLDGIRTENGALIDQVTGMKAQIVEVLSAHTEAAPAPDTKEIVRYITEACDEPEKINPEGRVSMQAAKFRGLDTEGQLSYGWRGVLQCDLRLSTGSPWAVLAEGPFTLENTESASTAAPVAPQRPHRWFAGAHYAIVSDPATFNRSFDEYAESFRFDPAAVRVYAGRRWFPLKRWTVRTGAFVDADAIGVDLGLDW